jgi:hypothetical protein
MSKDQYLEMMEQMGEEPDWEKCPPDWEDFPEIVITCINIFHSMGDRIFPEIGYIGKDYTNFEFLLKNYGIEKHQKEFVFETILWLDSRAIDIAQKKLKAEYDKIKRKRGR